MKRCAKCGEEKSLDLFNKSRGSKDGRKPRCKECSREDGRIYRESHVEQCKAYAKWYVHAFKEERLEYSRRNKDKVNGYKRKYVENNHEKRLEQSRRYYRNNKQKRKEYEARNRDVLNQKHREYLKNNPQAKIRKNLRTRIGAVIGGRSKGGRLHLLLGCSIDFFKQYLEAMFEEGMRWENYGGGRGKWNIDHIVPCDKFDLQDELQQKICFHYTNLQPMWHEENCSKSNRYCGKYKKSL